MPEVQVHICRLKHTGAEGGETPDSFHLFHSYMQKHAVALNTAHAL